MIKMLAAGKHHYPNMVGQKTTCTACSLGFSARNPANKMFWVRAICKYD
jgi:hypothetical protein